MKEETIKEMKELIEEGFSFLVKASDPSIGTYKGTAHVEVSKQAFQFSPHVIKTFTIYGPTFESTFEEAVSRAGKVNVQMKAITKLQTEMNELIKK